MEDTDSSSALSSAPSSPLSFLSRSPTPTSLDGHSLSIRKPYPSPSSSQDSSHNGSPAPMENAETREDGQPPVKRRKLAEPKPRTTLSLDLRHDHSIDDQKPPLDRLLKVLHKRRKIVVIAGAGISVSAGIPDFRSSTGLFQTLKNEYGLKSSGKDLFDASVYKDDNSTSLFHDMVRKMSEQTNNAQPTAFHHMLATLAHEGRLLRLYTQNVDGLETTLPPLVTRVPLAREDRAWPKTVQLHGSLAKMVCAKCHAVSDFESELFEGPVPPLCKACEAQDIVRTEHAGKRSHGVGILRPRMVLYSEHNPDADAIGLVTSADLRARPDAVIVVGTTLKVPGVKRIVQEMCGTVRDRRDGLTVWINTEDAPPIGKALEWDLIVKGPCDEVARHAALRQWDDVVHEVTDEEMRKAREASEAQVIVVSPAKPRTFEQVHGVPTPVASPKFLAKTTKLASIVEKNPSTLSSASTGKNAGKKTVGKATATTAPKAAAPKRKRQQAKKAEKPNAKIGFKITKASAPTAISKPDDKVQGKLPPQQIKLEQPIPQKPFPLQTQPIEFVEWKQENPGPMKVKSFETPRKPPPLPFSAPMAPLSPSDVRNNASPASPVAPGYSPYTPYRSKSLEVKHAPLEPLSLTQRRASEGTKASSGTISPTGYIPDNIRLLLD